MKATKQPSTLRHECYTTPADNATLECTTARINTGNKAAMRRTDAEARKIDPCAGLGADRRICAAGMARDRTQAA